VSGVLTAEDPDALADAMRIVATDSVLAERLRDGCAQVAAAHDIESSTRDLVSVYERLLARA